MAHLKHLQAGLHNINVGQVGHRDICRLYSLKKDLMMVNLDICRLYLFKERIMMPVTFIWQQNNFDSMQWWSIWISAGYIYFKKNNDDGCIYFTKKIILIQCNDDQFRYLPVAFIC